jgi:hypothetical protein
VTLNKGKLTINQATLTVTPANASREYGDANPALTGAIAGLKNGDNITATYSTLAAPASAVGTYDITAALNDPDHKLSNYTPTVNKGVLTINTVALTVTPDNMSRSYGDPNPAFTGTVIGIKNGDNITATYSTLAAPASAVGAYDITAVLNDPDHKLGNYTPTVNKGVLTVDSVLLTITPANAGRDYGDANPTFNGTITGIKNGDNITAAYSTVATAASPIGTYDITATLSDPDHKLGNYTPTLNKGVLTVNAAALTVTPDSASRNYGEANPAFAGTITGIKNGDNITANYSTVAAQASAVGTYDITAALNDPANKLPNYHVTNNIGHLTISKASLSVTPADASREYGAANPVFTGTISGLQNNDNITAAYSTAATPASPVGTYNIIATLNDPASKLTNYNVTNNVGHLTISKASLTVKADDASRFYGAANPNFTGIITGIVNGDSITASYASSATLASSVGTYSIIPALSDGGTNKLDNYTLISTNGTLTVTPASLTITPDGSKSKTFGSTFSAFTGTPTGLQNGDAVAVTYASTGSAATASVGSYDITVANVSFTHGLAANYTIVNNTASSGLKVNPASLTITPDGGKSKLLGSTFTALTGMTSGLQNGDTVSVTYESAGAPATATVGSYDITVATVTFTSGSATNYNVVKNIAKNGLVVSYNVCLLYDPTRAVKSGATYPIKFYVCNVSGADVSSPGVVVNAAGIYQSGSYTGVVEDAGNANPDSNFRYDSTLGPSGGYIFNLKTSGLNTGTFNLNFTVGGASSSSYSVGFGVK